MHLHGVTSGLSSEKSDSRQILHILCPKLASYLDLSTHFSLSDESIDAFII